MDVHNSYRNKKAPVWEYTASVSAGRHHWQESQSTVTPPTMHWAPAWLKPGQSSTLSLSQAVFFSLFQLHRPRGELPAALHFPLAVLFHGKFASCLL